MSQVCTVVIFVDHRARLHAIKHLWTHIGVHSGEEK